MRTNSPLERGRGVFLFLEKQKSPMQLITHLKHLHNKERIYFNSQKAFDSKLINNTLFNYNLFIMKKIYSLFLALFVSASAFAAGHVVTASTTGATCFGSCNGTASSLVSGAVGSVGFSWVGPSAYTSSLQNITGLCAGSYTITVTDSADMSTSNYVATVFQPTLLTVSSSGGTICSGSCMTLAPAVSGGTPGYTYSWSGGLFGPSPSVCPASTITYTVTVADANGCVATASSTVTVNPTPTVAVPSSYYLCFGTCVTMTASATGGPTFTWIPATGLSSTATASPTACLSTTTTYTVTASLGGCSGTALTTVYMGGLINSGITSTNTTGCATCDGALAAAPTGGTSPYTYDWFNGSVTPAVNFICEGTYSVTITDASGCTITDSATIFTNNDLLANFTMVPDSTNPYNFFAFNPSTGSGNSYAWDFGDGAVSTMASPSHTFALPGPYNVCLIASNFLCGADTLCQTVNVTGVLSSCNALFNIADDTINPDPNAHYVYNLSYGATLSYLWDFGDGTTSTSMTPSHVYAGTGPYLLCLSIDDGAGCTDMFCDSLISADSINRSSGIIQLAVYDVPTFYSTATSIANAIETGNVSAAPNPFNETTIFTVNSKEIYSFELTDILGKKVKSKNGISEKQFEISRDGLENGIYFYKIYTSESVVGIGKVVIK